MGDSILGMRVHPSVHVQPVPVLQITPSFKYCSDKFRAEWNAWALERFGTQQVAYMFDMAAFGMRSTGLFINPAHVAMLRNYA